MEAEMNNRTIVTLNLIQSLSILIRTLKGKINIDRFRVAARNDSIFAFTLAEVLITLGIIGVVAAITIPSLITAYRKKSYYTQFMKARSVIENALRMYADDYGGVVGCSFSSSEEIKNFGNYFKSVQYVTLDNYKNLCAGYDKIPVTWRDNKSEQWSENSDLCKYSYNDTYYTLGFLTINGMLLLFAQDSGYGCGDVVDVNGPNFGPNVFGRDIFVFYMNESNKEESCNSIWGISKTCKKQKGWGAFCYNTPYDADDCGARLVEEGKMNY